MNPLQYSPRQVIAFPAIQVKGRDLKVYGVFSSSERIAEFPDLSYLGDSVAELVSKCEGEDDHGIGFVILHLAKDGDYLLLSQWRDANMLQHQVYQGAVVERRLSGMRSLAASAIVACVWELEIMKFERDAWVRTVLSVGANDAATRKLYLDATFSGWI